VTVYLGGVMSSIVWRKVRWMNPILGLKLSILSECSKIKNLFFCCITAEYFNIRKFMLEVERRFEIRRLDPNLKIVPQSEFLRRKMKRLQYLPRELEK
jgi:hypothetical protein